MRIDAEPSERPLLVLLLDGVAYERVRAVYEAGHFRRFRPPARVISVFPTLTDPAYDVFFGTGPTPGYEAGYFDRRVNRMTCGLLTYLRGANERWVRHTDFRLSFVVDALMYLFPRWVYKSELRRVRRIVDSCLARGQRDVVAYILSTDGLGHMLLPAEIERELIRLDNWIERLLENHRGQLDIVILSDHGIGALPAECGYVRPFDLRAALKAAGLRVRRRLARRGDAAVPLFGLLDVGRVHTFDAHTRQWAVDALRARQEVELLAARDGDRALVYTDGGTAEIHRHPSSDGEPRYRYQPVVGDPLGLRATSAALMTSGRMDRDGFAPARHWLAATDEHDFPAAVPRLWDGLFTLCREQPDVVVSLREQWFVGSGLFDRFVRMHGTHGGLHRRASETFVMATGLDFDSPLALPDVFDRLRRELNWQRAAPR